MTRSKRLLLAGTILPALALIPLAPLFAQGPQPDERPRGGPGAAGKAEGARGPRPAGERAGGERPPGGPGGPGGPGARNRAEGAPGGGPGARNKADGGPAGGERRPGGAAGGPGGRDKADGGPAGSGEGRRARGAEGGAERSNRGEATRGEGPGRGRKAEDGGKGGPGGEKETRSTQQDQPGGRQGGGRAAQPRGERQQSRQEREERRDDVAPKGAARENPGADRSNRGRADSDGRGEKVRDRNERAGERGPGDRTRAGDRDEPRRDNRERAGDGRNDDRRDGDRPGGARQRAGDRDRRDDGPDGRPDNRRLGNGPGPRDDRRIGGGPAVVVAPGFGGGFLPPTQARRIDDLRRDRREVREGDSVFIREPGRTIVQERGRAFIVHDESARYRALGLDVRRERRGGDFVEITTRPGGGEILTYTDGSGRMLRRVRRGRDGREVVLIDNGVGGRVGNYADDVVALPPPPMRIPRERYIVDYRDANANVLYDTLIAPPLAAPPRRYTLDQIRYSPDVRGYVRSVDINTINFDTGSWDVPAVATGKLQALAEAINRAVDRNPNSVFLIEGYTDATGNPTDNLSLSDRRAQSVAEILTKSFKVPPENLTTQGYGQQNPKEDTQGPSAANRRVVVRNITQLLAAGDAPSDH